MDILSVGPNNMPCQLMVGFLAYAKSLEINVDKAELEGISNHYDCLSISKVNSSCLWIIFVFHILLFAIVGSVPNVVILNIKFVWIVLCILGHCIQFRDFFLVKIYIIWLCCPVLLFVSTLTLKFVLYHLHYAIFWMKL